MPLIFIDGPDGAGKTTLAQDLVEALREYTDAEIYAPRFPNNNIDVPYRDILMNKTKRPNEDLMLFLNNIYRTIEEVLVPKLESGAIVICDRSFLSTFVYQKPKPHLFNRCLDTFGAMFPKAHDAIQKSTMFIMGTSPEEIYRRFTARGDEGKNQFDPENMSQIEDLYLEYQNISNHFPQLPIVMLPENHPEHMILHMLTHGRYKPPGVWEKLLYLMRSFLGRFRK